MWKNSLTEVLGIRYPIIKAPMFGSDTPELIAEVSNAGGLGIYGVGRMGRDGISDVILEIRKRTDRPFGINVFVPEKEISGMEKVEEVNSIMNKYREELNITEGNFTPPIHNIEEQLSVLLEEKVPVVSFTFGYLEEEWINCLKQNGTIVVGTATTVREAVFLEKLGVDAIAAQGNEAGGHRGTFLGGYNESLIGTIVLVPQIVSAVNVPVIAAGGIMDGRGIVASFALGASGVQMGTSFLTCAESGAPDLHKDLILQSTEEQSMITTTFSGKPARGIYNRFKKEMEKHIDKIPGYPIQDVLTKDIRDAAAKQQRPEFLSLWAGQGTRLSRQSNAKELMEQLVVEAETTLRNLNR